MFILGNRILTVEEQKQQDKMRRQDRKAYIKAMFGYYDYADIDDVPPINRDFFGLTTVSV